MSDAINILNLLHAPRPSNGTVGWRDDIAVTHAEFIERLRLWQSLLLGRTGTRFALYLNDSIEFAAALFGAWQAGKIICLPSDTLPATCTALHPEVDAYLGDFPSACAPLLPREGSRLSTDAFIPLDADFAGLVVYTSGSTGAPQAIPKKLSQLATEVATLEQLFGDDMGGADVVATVSHQHIYGLLFKVLWPLGAARPIHARSLTYPEELAQTTVAHDCVLISSPAHLKRLPDSPAWANAAHRVRTVFSSGGPLPVEVAHATTRLLGRAPVEVYGSSETGGIAWRQRRAGADDNWSLMPGVESRINVDGDVLEIRSPHLSDANWFRTSDRARAVADGRLAIQGRVDRIVKIEEKRISLDLMEAQLMQSSLVHDARMLVIDGHRQQVAAFVVLSATGAAMLAASGKHALNHRLRDQLANAVERVALPRRWRYLAALPTNAQGKTTQAALAALLADEQPAAQPTMPHRQLLEREPQRALYELVAPANLLYFDGHFPQAPILPGVTQLEWALMLARDCFSLPPLFRGIHALKFQRVIRPDAPFSLELRHDASKDCVTFNYFSTTGAHASGRLMFGAVDV
jgi:acyl-coenzyme A synthetase/AMP-(fatty) acid ligase